jgi:hypothetical protein
VSALQWVVIAQCVLGTVLQVAMIGKARRPITPGDAVLGFVLNGIMVVLALTVLAP